MRRSVVRQNVSVGLTGGLSALAGLGSVQWLPDALSAGLGLAGGALAAGAAAAQTTLVPVSAALLVLTFSLACGRGRGVVRWRRVVVLVTTPVTVLA